LCQRLGKVPIDLPVLDRAAEIYAELFRLGTLVEDADLLIAAAALVNDLALVTHNQKHFQRIPNLALEDWYREER